MVKYWMKNDAVLAKVVRNKNSQYEMFMKGEKYAFPAYPRGTLLYGSLSPLKHLIKNRIFNNTWKLLEEKWPEHIIHQDIKDGIDEAYELCQKSKYDQVPDNIMNPPIKEIWRAMTVIEKKTGSERVKKLKEMLCFILQEDDAYRFRVQWIIKFFNPRSLWRRILKRNPIQDFDLGLAMIEHAEMIGDMKERQRLLRRGLICALRDPSIRFYFELLCKELDWNKLKLSKADKYFFRAKYFKVDYPEWQY